MTDVIISDATATVVSQANRKARKAKKAGKNAVTAKVAASSTLAWIKADSAALVSQGKAVADFMAACGPRGLGKTHEEANGEWRPTKAFQMFRTEYLGLLNAKHGDAGVEKGQIIIRFAFRALRVNMTPDAMANTVGKVQTALEAKEEAFAKRKVEKTDFSLGGVGGRGGRPVTEPKSNYTKALEYNQKADLTGEERRKLVLALVKEWKIDLTVK